MSATPRPPHTPCLDLLRGDPLPPAGARNDPDLYAAARREGLLPVIIDRLRERGWDGVDGETRAALEHERRAAIALATLATLDVTTVLGALRSAGVHALVIKGAALAHTHYPAPWLRPRIDTDLLIRRDDVAAAQATFIALGAAAIPHVTGEYVMSQFHYARTDAAACRHVYDVHWRIANPLIFAESLSYDEIATAAVPLTALGDGARAPGSVHALLLACIHRAAHHGGRGPLIWLFDIHLIAESLDEAGCAVVAKEAIARRIATVTAAAVGEAHAAFGGRNSGILADRLAGAGREEPSARFLHPRSRAVAAIHELRSLAGHRNRLRLAREWLLPPAVYMRGTYAPGSWWPLPVLYAVRAVRGAARWCRPESRRSDPERRG